jgi:hypothetical protein
MEPVSSGASGFFLSKVFYSIGGLFSGGALGAIGQPAALDGFGKYTKGLIIGGIGGGTPFMIGSFVAIQLGLDPYSTDVALFVGTIIGLVALAFFIFLRNYLKKVEDKDIFEVVSDTRKQVANIRKPAKPAAKKVAAKKTATRKTAKAAK